ncbi:MAG: transporter [Solirubrobacterales bacterium]|nr:transporter [Solirubrobacterales bacterium]
MTTSQRRSLAVICTATFMLLLDITVVNVALPDISRDLHTSFSDLQWVIDAYALSLAALLLTAGALSDLLGRKRIFIAGLAVFSVASLLCGLAGSPLVLNLARALQGVGGAAMFATSLALLGASFQGRQRGTAFGIWGATTGAAVAVGPLVGGLLTEHVSWQSIFFINVPIGALAIYAAITQLDESTGPAARMDPPGLVTFSGGLFFLVFALVRGNAEGWGSSLIVGFLIAAGVLLALFVVVESRRADPMLDLTLFRKPAFTGAAIAAFALSASMFSMFLYLTLYIQFCLGFKPLEAGIRFLPVTLLSFVVAPVAGKLSERMPVRYLLGGGLTLVGLGLLLMRGLNAESEWTALLPGFIVAGAGVGMTNPPLASTAIGVVDPRRSGMASGINTTFRQVGIATGIAALGAIFQSSLQSKLPGGPPGEVLANSGPSILGPGRRTEFLAAYTDALNELLLIAAIVALVGAVLALVLVRPRDFVPQGSPSAVDDRGASIPVAG